MQLDNRYGFHETPLADGWQQWVIWPIAQSLPFFFSETFVFCVVRQLTILH